MRWDASKRLCITEFNCNAAALPIEIGLPVKAYPPAQLSDELAEILLLSIQAAVTEQARQGWRTLFDSAQLPTTVAPIIQSALTPTPVSLWRAIGETLVEFAQELQIQVSEHVAQFIQLPVTLTPQLVVAADKFKGVGDAPTQRQTLTLSLPESDLALTFMPSTAGEDRTTTLGVALVQSSSAQPIGRAYITLRDDEQRTLEGGLTSSDGRIDFSDLLPGVYYVEVNYQNKVMRVGIRVTHSPAGVETRAINPTNVL